ncbi:MAG: NAD-dependent epimerase/dehydratase family protein [Treponema sp.]|jgi:UDP-glucuronate 4-epimerase|nr:NAD-dependent epimerase/dehydratase family protein [Treponema sp.]
MNYLVTGAAGFIGFYTAKKLLENGHKVLGIDSINDYYDPALKYSRLKELGLNSVSTDLTASSFYPDLSFARIEIENEERLFDLAGKFTKENGPFDRIIHLAAQAGVRYSLDNPRAYTRSNIEGFLSILELSRQIKIPHLVYASSSSVYGLNTKQPFSVHDEVNCPASLYAASKRSNELMAHAYSHLFGLPVTGLRFFTVYGPWGRPDMAYFKFSLSMIKGEPIELYNNGDMYRDFTYIDDVCEGILLAAERPPLSPEPSALYNLGNNRPEKLSSFVEVLENALGKKAEKKYLPMQAGDVYSTSADIEDTKRELGWQPHTNIEDGLKNFAVWFKGNYQ